MSIDLAVYLVTDPDQCAAAGRTVPDTVALAVAGGVTSVQVRAKDLAARAFVDLAVAVAAAVPAHVPVLVNDRVDVFLAARARGAALAGVHLGQDDLHPRDARALIGPDAVLGLSAATPAELAEATSLGALVDYVGIGAVRDTASKRDAPAGIGVEEVARLARGTSLPAVAIGGIRPGDVAELRAGGLDGVAVVSWICAAADPRAAAEELRRVWEAAA
ncbi:thiamine phosphate synthase [Pseudoclavibacter chungangensis]|uniref:Thiamine-phosphate synthase n=1 Tax=Pseudoclavibacter chungangensis TaxID=587635 RepID=A0A7J5C043_9MICO|nr:thiamine phosphate synthase [Pseudoclavibacter chungangensis]KAB1660271.1 thiamine phosphate synthase [Pseudoclavibacter chungangensis]NYJ65617.1 thiamine-phosphate pyrophosphorylase [Pseudoclavibacter chungangensis]